MDSLSPNIFVKDINATISFYSQLGFQLIMSVPARSAGDLIPAQGEGDLVWAMMTNSNVSIMFQTIESLRDTLPAISRQDGGSLLFYIKLSHIRAFFDNIKGKVNVIQGLQKTFYGATEFSITDNNNYVLTFAEDEGE